MEFAQPIVDALSAGADQLIDVAIAVASVWAAYVVAVVAKAVNANVPVLFRAFVAGLVEQALMPLVQNAVKAAEEFGNRKAKEGIVVVGSALSDEKVAYAKAYVLARVPDWVISDEKLGQLIDASLVEIGRGATKGISIGVDFVEEQIRRVPAPPVQ